MVEKIRVATGVSQLDRLLGGLLIGDNVVWYDDAGSLASVFCLNFIQASEAQNKHIIYVSFDRSPRNLLEKLGPLANYASMTILDCFTCGKGEGSEIFLKFYETEDTPHNCKIIVSENPRDVDKVMEAFYGIHGDMEGDVRFVFESLTGMQEIWGGEDSLLKFYTHSCPRLYELNTVAYWIMEKEAHSTRLKAHINQIAQVAIDLSVKRGTTSLMILKAENRDTESLNKPVKYWTKELNVIFDSEKRNPTLIDLGMRLKELRTKRGLSQTELAKLIGVTPSTISQVESNLIYPSLPALFKIAEILSIDVSSFFHDSNNAGNPVVFTDSNTSEIKFADLPAESIEAKLLTPLDFNPKAEPYLIEIQPKKSLPSHFFIHKGEEIGYLLSGKLQLKMENAVYNVHEGNVVYLTSELPTQWVNQGSSPARLLWFKIK
ncbi:MAG: helix-turn-helix domain-containing protein [Desulfobacteraceae bacterium]|jgi:transcriptional regulator with XRE-family HTH domain/KaiC/GvpD/RAD55 family RecA-like ATPase